MALTGLKARREAQERSRSKFFKLEDGQTVYIRPLVELDPEAKNFIADLGTANFTKEWQNPEDFTKNIVDTMETEGACVGQEMLNKFGWNGDKNGGRGPVKDSKGNDKPGPDTWRPKEFMYLPCLVRDKADDPTDEKVVVFKFNMAPKATQGPFFENRHDDKGTITDRWYSYSRKGKEQYNTTYTLSPEDADPKDKFNPRDYDIPDLEKEAPNVPYAEQRRALGIERAAVTEEVRPEVPETSIDSEW